MRIPLSWLGDFIDLPEDLGALTNALDDLGLVVESVEHIGEGLADVLVARIEEIHPIEGADRIRRVVADAGAGPIEIVCGAMNFEVGNHVPFAPVGAVLPGGFEIARRKMRGVTSNGMLCSGRELGLGEDHSGLMLLDSIGAVTPGARLVELLGIQSDVILEISPEGNRPDAWSVEGVARDLAARFDVPLRPVALGDPDDTDPSSRFASADVSAPDLCGALVVGVLRHVTVTDSPQWLRRRLEGAGMRAINNVVDASNYVMLELGQPTHPYDAALVSRHHIGVRRARPDEVLVTLDGVERTLGRPGRGLGDTGVDAVIVDGDDVAIGLAGIMGGASSVISTSTVDVLVEAAFFDPMTVARSSKRLGVRSEASKRFERGVDPTLASRALARLVTLLRLSSPDLEWWAEPLVCRGSVPVPSTISLRGGDVEALLGTPIGLETASRLLGAIGFDVTAVGDELSVTAPAARLDVRDGIAGRADVIEEIARLYGYQNLTRRTPTWVEPGGLTARQGFRRLVRETVVGLGFAEAWTETFLSDADAGLVTSSPHRVRVTNPLVSDEAVLRPSMLVGLARAWGRNVERGEGDVGLFEMGIVVEHPDDATFTRTSRGGLHGDEKVALPTEHEHLVVLLGRSDDDARRAVATWQVMADRWGLDDVVVRNCPAPTGWHPTRTAQLVARKTSEVVGLVGELDPAFIAATAPAARDGQRVGLLLVDLDIAANDLLVPRRSAEVSVPSRYPSAAIDLAFVTPQAVHAQDLAHHLRGGDPLVESVRLFDVFHGAGWAAGTRSLAYAIRLSAGDHTLSEGEIAACREALIRSAGELGAILR